MDFQTVRFQYICGIKQNCKKKPKLVVHHSAPIYDIRPWHGRYHYSLLLARADAVETQVKPARVYNEHRTVGSADDDILHGVWFLCVPQIHVSVVTACRSLCKTMITTGGQKNTVLGSVPAKASLWLHNLMRNPCAWRDLTGYPGHMQTPRLHFPVIIYLVT